MRFWLLPLITCLGGLFMCPVNAQSSLCPNPSFEQLNPAGDNFPLGWHAYRGTTITGEAYEGSIALRMETTTDSTAGVTSDSISVKRGKLLFHYKALVSTVGGDNLRFCVIAINQDGIEVSRAQVAVPAEHVGDGQWHEGSLAFDFLNLPAAVGVLIAPRLNEQSNPGEGAWLLDDIALYEERLGQRAEVECLWMPQPVMTPRAPTPVVVQVTNTGDMPVPVSKQRLQLTGPVRVLGNKAPLVLDELLPGESRRIEWQLVADEPGPVGIQFQWSAAEFRENTIVMADYSTVCIEEKDRSRLCTGPGGFWRLMPEPQSLQQDNPAPLEPLQTKRSSELPENYFGITAHLPRGEDFEPIFEPDFLIDGDETTNWSGHAHRTPVPGPVDWAEVTFARPAEIVQINLVPYWRAEGFPVDFEVKLRAGGEWRTVHQAKGLRLPSEAGDSPKQPYVIQLEQPLEADAIRIEVSRYSACGGFFTEFFTCYYFRLSEIVALDKAGRNMALASEGAKVAVPWTHRSWYNSREDIEATYPSLYDIGVKWNRVGQWGDWTAWAMVEQQKGQYYIDPRTDQAVTDSVENGVDILYTLDYGNPLYEATPPLGDIGPLWLHGHPFMGDGGPTTPEAIEGFVNYARFVAQHFKGRVKYYEIWNEENSWAWYGCPPDPVAFGTLLRETGKALKEVDPEIKVMVGGTAALAPTLISEALEQGAGPYLDAIGFHPYTMAWPELGLGSLDVVDGKQVSVSKEDLGFETWEEMLAFLKAKFEKYNPGFEFWANEWNAISDRLDAYQSGTSELAEAKQGARFFLMGTLTEVHCVWWSLANRNGELDWAVLRMEDLSPKPLYYSLRAMATLLSGAKPDLSIPGENRRRGA